MKSTRVRNLILVTGFMGSVLAFTRCSPNTASVTKAMLAEMRQPKVDNGDPVTPIQTDHFELHTHLLGDDSYADVLSGLTEQDFLIQISADNDITLLAGLAVENPSGPGTGADKLGEFKKNGSVEITLPANIVVSAKGDAYLDVESHEGSETGRRRRVQTGLEALAPNA